jgi:hypothetical protein
MPLFKGGSVMNLKEFIQWLAKAAERVRDHAPAWPPLIGLDGIDAQDDAQTRRIEEARQRLRYLHWPNI